MNEHKSYEDLKVWQKALTLAKFIYTQTKYFPKDELYGLVSQIRRSSVSVSSNIAEGCGRHNYKEFVHFIGIASGSLAELHTQLIIALDADYIKQAEFDAALEQIKEIGCMLSGLKSNIEERIKLVTSN